MGVPTGYEGFASELAYEDAARKAIAQDIRDGS